MWEFVCWREAFEDMCVFYPCCSSVTGELEWYRVLPQVSLPPYWPHYTHTFCPLSLSACSLCVSACGGGRHVSRPRRDFRIIQRIWNSSPRQRQLYHRSGACHIHNCLTAHTHPHTHSWCISPPALWFSHTKKKLFFICLHLPSQMLLFLSLPSLSVLGELDVVK